MEIDFISFLIHEQKKTHFQYLFKLEKHYYYKYFIFLECSIQREGSPPPLKIEMINLVVLLYY